MAGIKPKYELQITVEPPKSGKVLGQGKYTEGAKIQIDAIASNDWEFICWTGDISNSMQNFELVVDRDISITANFKKQQSKSFKKQVNILGILLLISSIANAAYFYIVLSKIHENKSTTNSVIIETNNKLNQELKDLVLQREKELDKKIEEVKSEQNDLIGEIRNLIVNVDSVNSLASSNIDYKVFYGELNASTPSQTYQINIGSSKSVEAYLSGMTADVDLAVSDKNGKSSASSTRSRQVPDNISLTTTDGGYYNFKVNLVSQTSTTKYKLEIYVRN